MLNRQILGIVRLNVTVTLSSISDKIRKQRFPASYALGRFVSDFDNVQSFLANITEQVKVWAQDEDIKVFLEEPFFVTDVEEMDYGIIFEVNSS